MPLVQKNDTCHGKSYQSIQEKNDIPTQEKHEHNNTSANSINNSSAAPAAQLKKHFLNKNGLHEKMGQHYLDVRNTST